MHILRNMMFPRLATRGSRRGSVLILVIAVLVLLALMGTAYITTSRSDRAASISNESTATIDTFSTGIIEGVKSDLALDKLHLNGPAPVFGSGVMYTSVVGVDANSTDLITRTMGLSSLAARVPTARVLATGTGQDSLPRWSFISSPIGGGSDGRSSFYSPVVGTAPLPAGVTYAGDSRILSNGFYTSAGTPVLITTPTWGLKETARRDLVVASVTINGVSYPAFQVIEDRNENGTVTDLNERVMVLAADADGDGIADSGYSLLGSLPNPAYAGITFYAGVRVIDNNSAINVNTAWSNGPDQLLRSTADLDIRNNRLFTTAVGLKETLTPLTIPSLLTNSSLDFTDHRGAGNAGRDLLGYKTGGAVSVDMATTAQLPARSLDIAGRPTKSASRTDYSFTTQHEVMDLQLSRHIDAPGALWTPTLTPNATQMKSFSLADQAALASGFVIAQKDPSDTFTTAIGKRSTLEQLLPYSLYRIPGNTETTGQYAGWGTPLYTATPPTPPTYLPYVPTKPYLSTNIGQNSSSPTFGNWFQDNFNYEFLSPASGATDNVVNTLNLRPLLVTHNAVSQSTAYKALPSDAVLPPVGGPDYDSMFPYVKPFQYTGTAFYNPGDVVFAASTTPGTPDGKLFVNASASRISNSAGLTVASGWRPYTDPVMPSAVNVNTAPYGDLWRGFYLLMSQDQIVPMGTTITNYGSLYSSVNNTVSPFGLPYVAGSTTLTDIMSTLQDELFRGMHFTSLDPPVAPNSAENVGGLYFDVDFAPQKQQDVVPSTDTNPGSNPTAQATYHPQRMFRSKIKDILGRTVITPDNMVYLRSAQASVNAEYFRSVDAEGIAPAPLHSDTVVRRSIPLVVHQGTGAVLSPMNIPQMAQVYSTSRHPYITEVYASTATAGKGQNYVAIELHNPYPFPISLENYKLEAMTRKTSAAIATAGEICETIFSFTDPAAPAPVIPANGYVVLENYKDPSATTPVAPAVPTGLSFPAPPNDRPPGIGSITAGGTYKVYQVPTLGAVLGTLNRRELILSRPMVADYDTATYTLTGLNHASADPRVKELCPTATTPGTLGKEPADYYVPVDSIDLSGLTQAPTPTPDAGRFIPWAQLNGQPPQSRQRTRSYAYDYHYVRETDNWKFVYPGRFDGTKAVALRPAQQGVRQALRRSQYDILPYTPGVDKAPPTDTVLFTDPVPSFGLPNTGTKPSTYDQVQPIQLASIGFGGPNARVKDMPSDPNRFPLGGFTRELDMLQVPYISPVRIRAANTNLGASPLYIDVISTTADAAFAEDSDTWDNGEENIGRMTPVIAPLPATGVTPGPNLFLITGKSDLTLPANRYIDEFSTDTRQQRYGWANRLLDYLTVRSVGSQSLPDATATNVDLSPSPVAAPFTAANYLRSTANLPTPTPPTAGASQTLNRMGSNGAGVQGLVNINTAPLPVLAAIPWTQPNGAAGATSTGAVETAQQAVRAADIAFAKAIIRHRETVGPFHSIFELNKVRMVNSANALQASTFRTGGITNSGASPTAIWPSALETTQPGVDRMRLELPGATTSVIRSPTNGDFSPMHDGTGSTPYLPPPFHDEATYPGHYILSATGITNANGNLNPEGDFEAQYLVLTGVSNLITVKSDTFTAYVVVEGWENAGTPTARRVLQRRYAYLLDRSSVGNVLPAPVLNARPASATPAGSNVIRKASATSGTSVSVTPIQVPSATP